MNVQIYNERPLVSQGLASLCTMVSLKQAVSGMTVVPPPVAKFKPLENS
jgi:hypothetical protein